MSIKSDWAEVEGQKIVDVSIMIEDIFETYEVSQVLAIYILERIKHGIHCQIDEDIAEIDDEAGD